MKMYLLIASLALGASAAYANDESDHWFNEGLAWYQHPCGMQAFVKYGKSDSADVHRNYFITQQHPEMCGRLFP
jgi:hypothetical protein